MSPRLHVPSPAGRLRAALALALLLQACGHEAAFEPTDPRTTEPLAPGPPTRLTYDARPDEWPEWALGGELLYTYGANTGDDDRCVGLLPGSGGQRRLEWCSDYPGTRDTSDQISIATQRADGALAFFLRRALATGGRGQLSEQLLLGRADRRVEESLVLADFPIPGPEGRPVQGVSDLAWLDDGRLGFVLQERVLISLCGPCPLDTLSVGRALATLTPEPVPGPVALLAGTTNATSMSVPPGSTEAWFTVLGDSVVYRIPLAGGPVAEVANFGDLGPVRDIEARDGALYFVAGGLYSILETLTNGSFALDDGGVIYRLAAGAATPQALTPLAGPYYRRPALSPDGNRLVAERDGDLWLLELP